MPQPIILPRRTNPWEQMMPSILSFLIQSKIGQRTALNTARQKAIMSGNVVEKQQGDTSPTLFTVGNKAFKQKPTTVGGRQVVINKGTPNERIINLLATEGPGGTAFSQIGAPPLTLEQQKELKRAGRQTNLQRKTRIFIKDGKTMAQEFNFDPVSGRSAPVGKPFPSKQVGTTELKISTGAEREALAQGAANLEILDNIRFLFDESFVGPIAGRVGRVKDIFGGNAEKQSEFNAATAAMKNATIKAITGAQMGEPEAVRIMKQIPDVNDPPSVWKAKWRQTRINLRILERARLRIQAGSGIRIPTTPNVVDQLNPDQEVDEFRKRHGL